MWRIGLFVICALLAAAHHLREGEVALVAAFAGLPLLFICRKEWVLVALQTAAYLATIEWIDVALRLIVVRQQTGRTWLLAAAILGSVAVLTALAGTLLNSPALRKRYAA